MDIKSFRPTLFITIFIQIMSHRLHFILIHFLLVAIHLVPTDILWHIMDITPTVLRELYHPRWLDNFMGIQHLGSTLHTILASTLT